MQEAATATGEEKDGFWTSLEEAVNPALAQPQRSAEAVVVRLEGRDGPYYVLKHPDKKTYLRLSEPDYALYWQMDGQKSVKDLLFYNFMRYGSLPFGRLNTLVNHLRDSHFLADKPTAIYKQVADQLVERAPASRGRRILNGFLYTEWSFNGLDPFFTTLYRLLKPLFFRPIQLFFLLVILIGGGLYARLFLEGSYSLIGRGGIFGLGFVTLLLANLLVIGLHELAHGLTVKHFGREMDRGGFLIYWGFPAFFVDTKDIWLSPRQARVLVSWAGPHSGLIIGGLTGLFLTLILLVWPESVNTLWAGFLYQVGFIAFLSVFINLNPLLELDGYFILMDWLEMPGLRQRAFAYLRQEFWSKVRQAGSLRHFAKSLNSTERVFTLFGVAAVFYSTYALGFALYFWQTRIWPLGSDLWRNHGFNGRLLVLVLMTLVVIPGLYFIGLFIWSSVQAGLEWLARRNLLARPEVLALLLGLPMTLTIITIQFIGGLVLDFATLFIHLGAMAALVGVARQLRGSRFQWAIWALIVAVGGITWAYLNHNPLWDVIALFNTVSSLVVAGFIAWLAVWPVWPARLQAGDRLMMSLVLILGIGNVALIGRATTGSYLAIPDVSSGLILGATLALVTLSPTLVNFWRSRFSLPWFLIALAILALPWLQIFPILHLPVMAVWFYAAMLYLVLGMLAQFSRQTLEAKPAAGERTRLINGFSHFLQAMFAAYEVVFGRRRLAAIQEDLKTLGFLDADSSVLEIAGYCRKAILLAVDRLDDLAGTPFTAQAGQAAYDSLAWPEAETLARYVLSQTEWGGELAEASIRQHNRLAELIRRADIFAGFDQAGVQALLNIGRPWRARAGTILAESGADATRFFLIESGEVVVLAGRAQNGRLTTGGYFGIKALLDSGTYSATYQAQSEVKAFVIDRQHFDPLLRADTTLASQVNSGAEERDLLKQMPLFAGLSPQQLTTVDARLESRFVPAGELIAEQGQTRSHLFIVFEGQVEAKYPDEEIIEGEPAGKPAATETFGRGEHFGEFALFADTPYQASYRAVVDTRLLLLDEPTFDGLVAASNQMSHYVEQIGSGRLIETRRRLQLSNMVG